MNILLHEEITQKIIHAFYQVYNSLGYGFLEKVYENAMVIELGKMDLIVQQQKAITVFYDKKMSVIILRISLLIILLLWD